MPKKTQMTDRIYEYLQTVIPQQGYAPSVREICDAVGLKSPSTVHFNLKRLQERGGCAAGEEKQPHPHPGQRGGGYADPGPGVH